MKSNLTTNKIGHINNLEFDKDRGTKLFCQIIDNELGCNILIGEVMISVSITTTQEKLVIRLKHRIEYVVEKKLQGLLYSKRNSGYVFAQLFFSVAVLLTKEILGKKI
ncbi:MAG: hypothetical protein Q8N03_00400 [Ignavibacteria bacterium]|nr:hypothetical protein [Ignavibacteria bacterium]